LGQLPAQAGAEAPAPLTWAEKVEKVFF